MPEEKRMCIERILDYTAQMSEEGRKEFLYIAEGFRLGLSAALTACSPAGEHSDGSMSA